MNAPAPRQTILPHNRPYLIDRKAASDLLYLSWGMRRYGASPIPVTRHEGWVYFLVRSGAPHLLRQGKAPKRIRSGYMLVISPDCASGWSDTGQRQCDVMTWVWKDGPRSAGASKNGCNAFHLDQNAMARACAIHKRCREEISSPDPHTPRTLQACRELLEIELERSQMGKQTASQPRLEFALAWLERHGHEPRSVSRLAEYLQISRSTLDRLFKREIRTGVAAWLHRKKMERAKALIQEGRLSRKEIAFELGYAHANDFSRAWTRWMHPAPDLRPQTGSTGTRSPNS